MTKRKFTPPTTFPAEYVNGYGNKITLLARGKGQYPLTGQDCNGDWHTYAEDGSFYADGSKSKDDLHDIPKKQVHWANDYEGCPGLCWEKSREDADNSAPKRRLAVIRREWVEGELPEYFVEEV